MEAEGCCEKGAGWVTAHSLYQSIQLEYRRLWGASVYRCILYTSDAAEELYGVELDRRGISKKK